MGYTFASIISRQEPIGHPWLDPETCVIFLGSSQKEKLRCNLN